MSETRLLILNVIKNKPTNIVTIVTFILLLLLLLLVILLCLPSHTPNHCAADTIPILFIGLLDWQDIYVRVPCSDFHYVHCNFTSVYICTVANVDRCSSSSESVSIWFSKKSEKTLSVLSVLFVSLSFWVSPSCSLCFFHHVSIDVDIVDTCHFSELCPVLLLSLHCGSFWQDFALWPAALYFANHDGATVGVLVVWQMT